MCTDLKGKMHGVCHINMIQQLTFRETENYLVQLGMCMTGCLADAYVHLLTGGSSHQALDPGGDAGSPLVNILVTTA